MFFSSAGAATAAVGPLVASLKLAVIHSRASMEALAEMTGAVKASMEAWEMTGALKAEADWVRKKRSRRHKRPWTPQTLRC